MTLEEVYKILETEKFNKIFNSYSLITKVKLIRIRKLYSLVFNIPEKEIYTKISYTKFFVNYINNGLKFDIDAIRLDLINNIPINTIALKYHEPIEVIEEIKENIDKDGINIVNSKIYTSDELAKNLKFGIGMVDKNLLIQNINLGFKNKDNLEAIKCKKFWLGKDINNNLENSLKKTKANSKYSNIYVRLVDFAKKINLPRSVVCDRANKGYKIFGIKMTFISEGTGQNCYFLKEEVEECVKNKKYYIEIKSCKNILNSIKSMEEGKRALYSFYKILYQKEIILKNTYIKKSSLENYINIYKLLKESYKKYFDYLYNFILKSEDKMYNLETILFSIYAKYAYSRYKNLYGETINKKTTIKILEEIKNNSLKYRKQ